MPRAVRANPIPTGFRALDQELGTGGWPAGRIVELFGEEVGARRFLLYRALGSAQRMGGEATLLCPEAIIDDESAWEASLDRQRLVILHPLNEEDALTVAMELTDTQTMAAVAVCGFHLTSLQSARILPRLAATARRTGTLLLFCPPPWERPIQSPPAPSPLIRRYADVRMCVMLRQEVPGRPPSVTLEIVANRVGGRRGRLTVPLRKGP